jgi:UDP-2,3-diacylglucosamine hydrolase
MSKIIHLISDLHLSEDQPHLLALFEHYMQNIAPKSQQLYVLGDFFEIWVGDDFSSPLIDKVIALFQQYSANHGELFIMHGNRDFLIGQDFANECGAELIEEPYKLIWQDKKITLMHGDILCTDDTAYQEFRTMVRTPQWQQQFLAASIEQRLEIAGGIKQKSKDAQKEKQAEIMDVNSEAVIKCIDDNQCDWLIHGHTHREGQHQITLANGTSPTRIVLSDWRECGHYIELSEGDFSSQYFEQH